MKKLHISLLLSITLLCAGCANKRQYSYWPKIDKESDELLDSLERFTIDHTGADRLQTYTTRLDSLAETAGERESGNQLRARAAYWKAIMQWYAGNDSLYNVYGQQALNLCDSTKYPYDYARIADEFGDNFDEENYSRMVNNIDTFLAYKDTFNFCQGLNRMAILLTYYYDNESALKVYDRIDKLTAKSYPQINYTNRVNRAMLYEMAGDTAQAISEGVKCWGEKMSENPRVNGFTGRMKFLQTNNPEYIRKIVNRYLDKDSTLSIIPHKEMSLLLTYYVRNNKASGDSARILNERLSELASDPDMSQDEPLKARAAYASAIGDSAVAVELTAEYQKLRSEAESARKLVKLQHKSQIETLSSIMEEHYNEDLKVIIWSIVALLLLGAIGTYIGFSIRKKRRAEILQREESLTDELNQSKRKLTVAELKTTISEQRDWELFEKLYIEMDPHFIEKLKHNYPLLTQGDVRLVCLLKMGMDSKQIARLLNITPDSVKKSRYRLRSKLGIPTKQTFDQFFAQLEGMS